MEILPKFFEYLFNNLLVTHIGTKPYNRKRIFLSFEQEYPFSIINIQ